MGELAEKVKKMSAFLKLEGGESIVAVYKGFKIIPSSYDPDKEMFRFILNITVDGEELQKYWDTGSSKVAMVFDAMEKGDKVRITKNIVEKNGKESTSWEVEPVEATEKPVAKVNDEVEDTSEEDALDESLADSEVPEED